VMGLSRAELVAFERVVPLFERGRSPSLDEMASAANLSHRSIAHRYVRRWRDAGLITFIEGERRSYELVRTSDRLREFSDAALLAEVKRRGIAS